MTKKIKSIGILKESRPDESRAPIAPSQVSLIIKKYPLIKAMRTIITVETIFAIRLFHWYARDGEV